MPPFPLWFALFGESFNFLKKQPDPAPSVLFFGEREKKVSFSLQKRPFFSLSSWKSYKKVLKPCALRDIMGKNPKGDET